MSDNENYRPTQRVGTHLNSAQRSALAGKLQTQLAALKQQLYTQAQTALAPDDGDGATRAGEHEVATKLSDLEQIELDAVSEAMLRVNKADYGICIDCGLDISFVRLQAEPQARRCLACQRAFERLAA